MMILSDNETKIDMLNNRAIAKTVVELIKESQDNPISIGIHGDWGAGKSSVLEMVADVFEDEKDIECIKFNGWKHQGFEDAKIALMSAIVSELIEKRKLSAKCGDAVKKIWKNINWLTIAKGIGGIALTATTGIAPIGLLTNMLNSLKSDIADKDKVNSAIESVGTYLTDAKVFEDTSSAKEFAEFQSSFSKLLEEASIKKLVVLIDDLDRCLPEVTIETLEAIRLFMFSNSTAFVIAADEAMIEYAVKKHFPDVTDIAGKNIGKEFSKRYLEKLIQVPFRIPALGEIEAEMYITLLLIGSKLQDNDERFESLLKVSIEKMKKPWKNKGLTISELHDTLKDKYDTVANEVVIANQVSPILACNTDGNPRKIKRFINMLLLRQKIAEARGFGDEIQIPILAKMMLAEYFLGEFYADIAIETDDYGKCSPLSELEKHLLHPQPVTDEQLEETTNSKTAKKKAVDLGKNPVVISAKGKTWSENSEICKWVISEPYIDDTDLRPYYFASKEKEDYFFNQVKSEKLRYIVDKLMSSSMNIAGISGDVQKLSDEDSKIVFDILTTKILRQSNIASKPKGIDGIIELVKTHQDLQGDLLTLIDSFNVTNVGAWVCSGWNKCITSESEQNKLNAYYDRLSENGNSIIQSILKTTRK